MQIMEKIQVTVNLPVENNNIHCSMMSCGESLLVDSDFTNPSVSGDLAIESPITPIFNVKLYWSTH